MQASLPSPLWEGLRGIVLGGWLTPSTDADALLARKGSGKEAKLSYCGNLLTENRNGLIVNTEVFPANGLAERAAARARHKRAK